MKFAKAQGHRRKKISVLDCSLGDYFNMSLHTSWEFKFTVQGQSSNSGFSSWSTWTTAMKDSACASLQKYDKALVNHRVLKECCLKCTWFVNPNFVMCCSVFLRKEVQFPFPSLKHWKKIDLSHSMEIFWKYCRKRLENPISIVLSSSTVWKCFPWYGNILEILWKYSGNKSSILWKRSLFSSEVVQCVFH